MIDPPSPHPVVACWGGAPSVAAVELAAAIARALHEPLIIATAYEYEPTALTSDLTTPARNQARALEAEAALDVARELAGADVRVELQALPSLEVPQALRELAREVDASMLVVARDRAGHRVVRQTVRHAPCPIAVTDAYTPRLLPARIGVAYDDSDSARTAVRVARRLAAACDARVQLLCVDGVPGPWPRLVESGAALGVDVHPALRLHGDRVTELRRVAADLDLLVCGTHGRGAVSSMLLGSVSRALIDECPCHLLVVPSPARRRATLPLGVTTAAL